MHKPKINDTDEISSYILFHVLNCVCIKAKYLINEQYTILVTCELTFSSRLQFEDCTFDWLYWPQARQPFSQETIDYIKSLDAEQDIAILKFYGLDLSPECARIFRISTMLLKKGAERGLSPYAIGNIMCRETLNKKSMIEEIVQDAKDSMLPGMSEAAFLETVSEIMDTTLDKLLK